MPNHSKLYVAQQAKAMRDGQKLYFELIAKAKKTKVSGDFAAANMQLKKSKEVEARFDEMIEEVLNEE